MGRRRPSACTITEATDYAEGTRSSTVSRFEQHGGQVVAAERYSSDITDFRSQLSKVLAATPDAVHLAPQSEFAAGAIIKQARGVGIRRPHLRRDGLVGRNGPCNRGRGGHRHEGHRGRHSSGQREGPGGYCRLQERYDYVSLPWHLSSTYDDVYITAECLRQTGDDQDADGFRDCLYGLTWSGAIGENYSFDENGEVVGLSRVVVQVLPVAERTADKNYVVLDLPVVDTP